ncbi:MAG: hypothetical protein VKN72_20090 [Nostocales cyanobacterium 94392]|nr:hypothetical protein [Nostocales cyanobacterium 94392]
MSHDFKIVMLGTSGAGKTCYMLGMYAVMQIGFHGFTITAKDYDQDNELSNKWQALIEGEGESRWPAGTDQPHFYRFNLNYGARPMIEFEWLDYRGGAMSDQKTENDVQILRDYLKSSSCIFLCISGEYLKERDNLGNAVLQAKVGRMNQFLVDLNQEINPSDDKPFPIVIILTKYDECKHRQRQELYEDIQKILSSLFTRKSGWLVTICPVSIFNGKQIAPQNVHHPLFFGIYSNLRQYSLQKNQSSQNHQSTQSKSGNWLTRITKFGGDKPIETPFGEFTPQVPQTQADDIQEKLSLLAQEIKGLQVYLSGEEIKNYYD